MFIISKVSCDLGLGPIPPPPVARRYQFFKKDERERERANFQSVTMILNECFESLIIMITFPFRIVEAAAMDLAYDSVLLVETHLILLYH